VRVRLARFRTLAVGRGRVCLLWTFAYLMGRNLFALVWLLARPRRSKELEILLLRHELAVLRRHAGRPRLTRADRALFAALSRAVPRTSLANLAVKPNTLLRWHRQLVARRWTYAHRKAGRPPLESSLAVSRVFGATAARGRGSCWCGPPWPHGRSRARGRGRLRGRADATRGHSASTPANGASAAGTCQQTRRRS
jgi:hypothetical protein